MLGANNISRPIYRQIIHSSYKGGITGIIEGKLPVKPVTRMSAAVVSGQQNSETDAMEDAYPGYPLVMIPLRQTKNIHFIRHGQGFHNVAGHADHENYKSEEW